MNQLLREVDHILADPLAIARRHATSGRRVIGFVGSDVPVELIMAADAFPVALPCLPGATPRADEYLESTFSPAARSISEQWLTGNFDFIEAVVFPRSTDSLQRTYYYVCELQRRGLAGGPRPLLFDVAKIPRSTSVAHTHAATLRLAGDLRTDLATLPEAIVTRNRRRRLMNELLLRRRAAHPPGGADAERVARASEFGDAACFDAAFERWLSETPPPWRGARLLLAGSEPPDGRLHAAAEAAGARVVDEFGDHANDRLGDPISSSLDPLAALAGHHATLRAGSRNFTDRAALLAQRARAAQADGVVLWIIEEDESIVWDVPAMKFALEGANIPLLELTHQTWDGPHAGYEMTQFVRQLGKKS